MRKSVDDNILFSFMSRVLDLWDRKKVSNQQIGDIINLCFEQGGHIQKTSALRLLNREMVSNIQANFLDIPLEKISEQVLNAKHFRETESLVSLLEQIFPFLLAVIKKRPNLLISKNWLESSASIISLLSTIVSSKSEKSTVVLSSSLTYFIEVLQMKEFK